MQTHNMAIVFAPTVLRPEGDDLQRQLRDGGHAVACVQTLLDRYDEIFLVISL